MRAAFDYLFYCFYCLTSAKNFDRAGASRSGVSLFVFFALLDVYTLAISLLRSASHFFIAGTVSAAITYIFLHLTYYRAASYAPLLDNYTQGEPKRLRFALIGVALLLSVMFLPFLLLKARRF